MKLFLLIFLLPFTSAPIGYRQLRWEDFKGKPTNDHAASTCTGIVIEKDTAYAVFEPDRSWTRTKDGGVLRHEQLHFAITAMYAQFINTDLKNKDHHQLTEDLLENWGNMEVMYERETDHGRDSTAQKRWEQMIKL